MIYFLTPSFNNWVVFPRWPSIGFKTNRLITFQKHQLQFPRVYRSMATAPHLHRLHNRRSILHYRFLLRRFLLSQNLRNLCLNLTIYKIFIVAITKKILKIIFVDGHGVRHDAIKMYNDKIQMSIAP